MIQLGETLIVLMIKAQNLVAKEEEAENSEEDLWDYFLGVSYYLNIKTLFGKKGIEIIWNLVYRSAQAAAIRLNFFYLPWASD